MRYTDQQNPLTGYKLLFCIDQRKSLAVERRYKLDFSSRAKKNKEIPIIIFDKWSRTVYIFVKLHMLNFAIGLGKGLLDDWRDSQKGINKMAAGIMVHNMQINAMIEADW